MGYDASFYDGPSPFAALVGQALGGFQAVKDKRKQDADDARKQALEDQRAKELSDANRRAEDANTRAASDDSVRLDQAGYRDPSTVDTSTQVGLNIPGAPGAQANISRYRMVGGRAFDRVDNPQATARQEAIDQKKAEQDKNDQWSIAVGAALGAKTPEERAAKIQSALRLRPEGASGLINAVTPAAPANIDPNSEAGIKARERVAAYEASLRKAEGGTLTPGEGGQGLYRVTPDNVAHPVKTEGGEDFQGGRGGARSTMTTESAQHALPKLEESYAIIQRLRAKGWDPSRSDLASGQQRLDPVHGLMGVLGRKVSDLAGVLSSHDNEEGAQALRNIAANEMLANGSKRIPTPASNANRAMELGADLNAVDAMMESVRTVAGGKKKSDFSKLLDKYGLTPP